MTHLGFHSNRNVPLVPLHHKKIKHNFVHVFSNSVKKKKKKKKKKIKKIKKKINKKKTFKTRKHQPLKTQQ